MRDANSTRQPYTPGLVCADGNAVRRIFSVVLCCVLLVLVLALPVFAHEVRPAYLQLRQIGPDTYDVLWKVPVLGDELRLGLYVELPEGCVNVSEPRGVFAANAHLERWRVQCRGGWRGSAIRIAGLSTTPTDVLARVERSDGTTQVSRLTPSQPAFIVEDAPSIVQVAGTYLRLGIEHILLGIDHLLFVLSLLLLVQGGRCLMGTVTAFTVAHSLTLAAATLGVVHVPQAPVEAVIALSIVFVASEIVHGRRGRPGLTERRPWLVAFSFGLLHGFGFAGALSEVGLPQTAIPLALLFFNIGVELGQLLFIAAVLAFLAASRRALVMLAARGLPLSSAAWEMASVYAIGGVAAYWFVERMAGFI
jgi:hypothetical protein